MGFNSVYPEDKFDDVLTIQTIDFLKDDGVPTDIRKTTFTLIYKHHESCTSIPRRSELRKAVKKQCAYEDVPEEVWKGK